MKPLVFSAEDLAVLVAAACQSPRRRQHRNLHATYEDPAQRVLNAIGVDSYIRPHRHHLDPKPETLIALQGLFALICFNDSGAVDSVVRFGSEKFVSADVAVGVQVSPETWHTVLALVEGAVILEVKSGPFRPDAAKEFAAWAPEESSAQVEGYLRTLKAIASVPS